MAKVEIEESELASLQRVNNFATAALANPKTRTTFLKVQKTLNPDAVIPELDATESVMTSVSGVEQKLNSVIERLEARETAAAEAERTRELQGRVSTGQKLLRDGGYTAEAIGKIEALMLERGIADYEAGMVLFDRLNPAPPPSDGGRSQGMFGPTDHNIKADDYKALWESQGSDDGWLNQTIATARREFH